MGDASEAPPLLAESVRSPALQAIHSSFTKEVFLDWQEGFDGADHRATGLAEIPAIFEELYVGRAR